MAYLRRSLPTLFHTAFPIQPPPLRGTSFHRKEGVSTRAPSLGRGCRAQQGGVGFLFCGARVLSQTAYLRRSPSLSFIPLVPYPARSARHLPHAGKALCREKRYPHFAAFPIGEGFVRRYCFSTYACICSDNARKAVFSFRCLPHWGRGTAQRWIGCFRISSI